VSSLPSRFLGADAKSIRPGILAMTDPLDNKVESHNAWMVSSRLLFGRIY
jgi:hypothetical protein